MTSRIAVFVVLVACGGGSAQRPAQVVQPAAPEEPAPAPTAPTPAVEALAVAEPEPAPAAEPPPAVKAKPLYERLRDTDGKVAGLAGFSIKRKPDAKRCGGIAIVTTRGKKVAKDDAPLAAVYKLEFPTGLFFDPDPKHAKKREASMKKFQAFLDELIKVGSDARKHYEDQLANGDATAKVAAAARIGQINLRTASLLARAEMPADVRTGEFAKDKMKVFCDALVERAEPLQAQGETAMAICAEKAKDLAPGWWNDVCVAP